MSVPIQWRSIKEKYRLGGTKCERCGRVYFPSRKICPNCRREGKLSPIRFSGRGKVYSYSIVRNAPEGFEIFTPYVIGLVELEEGPKLLSQIVDCKPEDVYIGMPLETTFRRLKADGKEGVISYSFKFVPATSSVNT